MGAYFDRLQHSEDYINLSDARIKLSAISNNFRAFIGIVNRDVEGNVVDNYYKSNFNSLKNRLTGYYDEINSIIEKLEDNAGKGDDALKWYQDKAKDKEVIGTNISSSMTHKNYEVSNPGYIAPALKSEPVQRTVFVHTVTKVEEKISSADIGDGGYIQVNTVNVTTIYTYESVSTEIDDDTIINNGTPSSPTETPCHIFLYDFDKNLKSS